MSAETSSRKRVAKTEDGNESDAKKKKQTGKLDPVAVFYAEEELASQRNPEQDVEITRDVCNSIRDLMGQIKDIKNTTKDKKEIEKLRVKVCMHFLTLKRMNRLVHLRTKKSRDATVEAKQQVDACDLQLQNLLCEKMHLKRTIAKCYDFKSRDENIELVDEQTFYCEAPPEVSRPESTSGNPHLQRLARLDWENRERQRLSVEVAEGKKKLQELEGDISKQKEKLSSLAPKLQDVLKATRPVQDHLDLAFEDVQQQHSATRLLPRPLYTLAVTAMAHRDSLDPKLTVRVEGDAESAATLEDQPWDNEAESDSDDEQEGGKKNKRHGERTERLMERRKKLLRTHPLAVILTIPCDGGLTLQLTFQYVLRLRVITVAGQLQGDLPAQAVSGGDMLAPLGLLSGLYPGDSGLGCPGPAAQVELDKVDLEDIMVCEPSLGRPFVWAQRLAGLDLLSPRGDCVSGPHNMRVVLRQLRLRLASRVALLRHLVALEDNLVGVSSASQGLFPPRVTSALTGWQRTTFAELEEEPFSAELIKRGVVSPTDLLFVARVARNPATARAYIAVPLSYPTQPPVFLVEVNVGGHVRHRANDSDIRDLEAEVNVYYEELIGGETSHDELLTNQLQRLLVAMDIYLETTDVSGGVTQLQSAPKAHSGVGRCRPYQYRPSFNLFLAR